MLYSRIINYTIPEPSALPSDTPEFFHFLQNSEGCVLPPYPPPLILKRSNCDARTKTRNPNLGEEDYYYQLKVH